LRAQSRIEDRMNRSLGAIHGLALKDLLILMHLDQSAAGRLSRTDLARRLNVSASTMTRAAAPMEKTGLVERQTDPRDARLAYVSLTESGRRLAREARASFDQTAQELFRDRWDDADIGSLTSLLARLNAAEPGELI